MEALGGNEEFADRFTAQHIAFFYYWLVVGVYILSPAVAYDLNKYVERHAFNTYSAFVDNNVDMLKALPPPPIAVEYYMTGDPYMFDAFQSNIALGEPNDVKVIRRRPVIENLYDVFCNIRDDEGEHADTMLKLQRDVSVTSRGKKGGD
jgi:ubiquinol oxidase